MAGRGCREAGYKRKYHVIKMGIPTVEIWRLHVVGQKLFAEFFLMGLKKPLVAFVWNAYSIVQTKLKDLSRAKL